MDKENGNQEIEKKEEEVSNARLCYYSNAEHIILILA